MNIDHLFIYPQFLSSVSCSFQCTDILPPWLNLSEYFTIFDAIVNGIVVLTSLSDSLLLVHKNTTDFLC